MSSVKDVATMAQVSTATVSRVLADKPHVRPEIRERVLAAVQELNYRPNRVARSLRVQQSSTIGLIVSDIQNPFFTEISRSVEDTAYQQGLSVFLCNTDENPAKEQMYLELMNDENVAGIILSPTRQTTENFKAAFNSDIPVVVIDRRVTNAEVDNVLIDNMESAYKLVEHLITDGYQRIGAVFSLGSTTGVERREGYIKALKAYGLKVWPELISNVNPREEDSYEATLKLLNLSEPPQAIFTSNSLLTSGAIKAIRQKKLRIPDDIALGGFDETTWTTLIEPAITLIQQPTYEIGQTATELLLKRIEDPNRPAREVILRGKLIVRQSCKRHE